VQDCQTAVLCAVSRAVRATAMIGPLATPNMLNVWVPAMVVIHVEAGAYKTQICRNVKDRRHVRVVSAVRIQRVPVVSMYM